MEQPAAFVVEQKLDRPRVADLHAVGNDQPLSLARQRLVGFAVAFASHAKIMAVQMHWMIEERGVDQTPVHRLAHAKGKLLGMGPGFAVDHGELLDFLLGIALRRPLEPEAHDEDPVGGVLSRRIDDQRARQLRVDAGPAHQAALGRRRPVVVGTRRRQFEA